MRCSPSAEHRRAAAFRPVLLALCLSLAASCAQASTAAAAGGSRFIVEWARTTLVDGVYLLDADVRIGLGHKTREALNNGVTLPVVIEMQVVQPGYLWDSVVAELHLRYRLLRHALSQQFVLRNLNTGAARSFRTYQGAIDALGSIRRFPLIDASLLHRDQRYLLRIRALLDIEALPTPMRFLAYLDAWWRGGNAWYTWPLHR